MPVEDHAIHPSTQIGKDWRYGCFNRPEFKDECFSYFSGESWPFVNSKECKHDIRTTDPNCAGCFRAK